MRPNGHLQTKPWGQKEFAILDPDNNLLTFGQNMKNEELIIHPDHKKSADLIYLSGALGIGNLIWSYDTLDSGIKIFIALISVAFIFGIGYLVSKGTEWIKYFLLVILILGLLSFPLIIADLKSEPVIGTINIFQTILQIWALVLLFKIPKTA